MTRRTVGIRHHGELPSGKVMPLYRFCPVCKGDVWFLTCQTCLADHYRCDVCNAEYILRVSGWFRIEDNRRLTRICDAPSDEVREIARGVTIGGEPFAVDVTPKDAKA